MSAIDKLLDYGYEDVTVFDGDDYDDAIIGVTSDNKVVYEFEKMVQGIFDNKG